MPPLVVPNTIEVVLYWQLNNEDHALNVLHYLVPGGFDVDQTNTGEIRDVIAAAFVAGTPTLRSRLADNYQLNRVGVRDLSVANQPEFFAEVLLAGLAAGDVLPLATSLVVTLRTALAGRSYRGRTYITGFSESSNDGFGRPIAADRQGCENFFDAIQSMTVDSNLLILGVTSRVNEETRTVQSAVVRELRWATQRRRNVPGI